MAGDNLASKLLAEAIGVFIIVLVGSGAVIVGSLDGGSATIVTLALSTGIALSVAISALLHVSGAHFNPAVSLAMFVSGRQEIKMSVFYIASQLVGGVLAGAFLYFTLGSVNFSGTPQPGAIDGVEVTTLKALLWEFMLTALLMFSIMGTIVDQRTPRMGGWGVGGMVAACLLIGIPVTGAAMNPARHFGSALFEGTLGHSLIYWIGPILGAIVCTLIYDKYILNEE